MRPFEYIAPITVRDAVSALTAWEERARVLSGGTDILIQMRTRRRTVDALVDIKGLAEVNLLSFTPRDGLTLGAAVPCYRIYGDPVIAQRYPGITDAASLIGGIQIQGRASLGGNLSNAAPSADGVPPLIAQGAIAVVAGPHGARRVAVEDYCTGPGRTVLQPDELLLYLNIPAPHARSGAHYVRFIPRNEMDIAVAGAAAHVSLTPDGKAFNTARIALSAVAPTPLFVREAGASLVGEEVSEAAIARAAEIAQQAARPIDDMRGTAEYRRHLVGVLTKRALRGAVARARGEEMA
jgi:carbon-monoxide dehydrogenase medium subunit